MILEILPNPRQIRDRVDAEFLKKRRIPYTRELKDLRGVHRSSSEDNFFVGGNSALLSVRSIDKFNSYRSSSLEKDSSGCGTGENMIIWTAPNYTIIMVDTSRGSGLRLCIHRSL